MVGDKIMNRPITWIETEKNNCLLCATKMHNNKNGQFVKHKPVSIKHCT